MKILFPWNNLGCLGFRFGPKRYFDIFKRHGRWYKPFGVFYLWNGKRGYLL